MKFQPPEQDEHGRRTYIQGVEGDGRELIGILDLEQLLQDQR
ncbi:hypothetical protein [Insulibacter thermoxylanivorax]|nr:hypothetical protein [Insulibacter thermoxylanivorax]